MSDLFAPWDLLLLLLVLGVLLLAYWPRPRASRPRLWFDKGKADRFRKMHALWNLTNDD